MGKVGKRTKKAMEAFNGKSNVSIEEAVKLVKSNATAKFDETIEIAMNLGVDTRHADQMVRGVVGLPNGTGKSMRVAVFARDPEEHTSELQSHSDLVCRLLLEKKNDQSNYFDLHHTRLNSCHILI